MSVHVVVRVMKTFVGVDGVIFIIGEGDMHPIEEEWKRIKEFRNYEVSNLGRVANSKTDIIVQPSLTLQGALKVGLYDGTHQYTRSLKVLVAEAFVKGRTETFDTPVLLDGDQLNCVAHNLVWRPRWLAWHFARQFRRVPEFYHLGPIVEIDEWGIVCGVYNSVVEIGTTLGVLFDDVWDSIHTKRPVFPTNKRFAFADKV